MKARSLLRSFLSTYPTPACVWSSRVLGICGSSSKPLFPKHLTPILSFQYFQYVCWVPQVFLTNAPRATAAQLGRRQGKSKLLTWLLQEGPRQVESNNHNSLRTRSAPFPHYYRRWGWGQEKLKATKISFRESVSFFLIKHSSGCCKSLTSFQSSSKIDFDRFCPFIHCFCGGMISWSSYPHHFTSILTQSLPERITALGCLQFVTVDEKHRAREAKRWC